MDPSKLLGEDVFASVQSTRVLTDVQLVHLRDQIAIYKTLCVTSAKLKEQQAAKAAIAQHAAQKAAAAKRPRTPGLPSAPAPPTLHISEPIKLNLVVQDSKPVTEPEASEEASEPSASSDDESNERGSRDSNLATDEEADTSDMCDDSDDGPRRKRGRRAREPTPSDSEEEEVGTRVRSPPPFEPATLIRFAKPVRWPNLYQGDQPCDVCADGDSDESNPLLLCDGCDVAVHRCCYGLDCVPEGDWFCDGCAAKLKKNTSHCAVCPVVGGALRKVTSTGGVQTPPRKGRPGPLWVHAACALWNTEITFANPDLLCDVRLDGLSAARAALKCAVCGQQGGGVVQCGFLSCRTPFHVLCGRSKGFVLDFADAGPEGVPEPMGFCATHSTARFAAGRMRVLKRIITDEQEELRQMDAGAATAAGAANQGTDNEYEQQRQRNMARNAQMLSALLDHRAAA